MYLNVQQVEQCQLIFKWMDDVIICGDCNSTPNSKTYKTMVANG